jgi:hypothetical protein
MGILLNESSDRTCFVIMPFGEPFDTFYRSIFRPVIEKIGLRAIRADEISTAGVIINQIWEGINKAEICLADITGNSSNVMFELGLAHAIGKPVVQIAQTEKDIPFDLRPLRHITYRTEDALTGKLGEELQQILKGTLMEPEPSIFLGILPAPENPTELRPIPDLCIRNVFAIPEENPQRNMRMKELLSESNSPILRLSARTGFHYLHEMGENFILGIGDHLKKGKSFQVLLENPYSQNAEARRRADPGSALWDKLPPTRICALLKKYRKLKIHFTDAPISCSLFFLKDSVIFDPYNFGRLKNADRSGNQFLVIEFQRQPEKSGTCRDYYALLKKHFDFLWKDEKATKTLKDLCNEHEDLRQSCGCPVKDHPSISCGKCSSDALP